MHLERQKQETQLRQKEVVWACATPCEMNLCAGRTHSALNNNALEFGDRLHTVILIHKIHFDEKSWTLVFMFEKNYVNCGSMFRLASSMPLPVSSGPRLTSEASDSEALDQRLPPLDNIRQRWRRMAPRPHEVEVVDPNIPVSDQLQLLRLKRL